MTLCYLKLQKSKEAASIVEKLVENINDQLEDFQNIHQRLSLMISACCKEDAYS